jgi:hypothetical protein
LSHAYDRSAALLLLLLWLLFSCRSYLSLWSVVILEKKEKIEGEKVKLNSC